MNRLLCLALPMALIAACASGGGAWTPASWAAQTAKTFNQGPYAFSAAPYGEDGFKLTLKLRPSAFGVQSAGSMPDDDDLRAAAEAAAPEGCSLKAVTRTETGEAIADYDCG